MRKIYLCFLITLFASCAINKVSDERTVISLEKNISGNPVVISVERGAEWVSKITPGPFVIYIYPQIVFWLEDGDGNYIETLYISGADGNFSNHAAKKKMDQAYFRESLPVWAEKIGAAGENLPGKDTPYSDAVTSATPQSSFDLEMNLGELSGPFKICAEINKTADYNDVYTEDLTDWIGQPSVIYDVTVNDMEKGQAYTLNSIGHSQLKTGALITDDDFKDIDSALKMVEKLLVTFK